jgi:hypothetical protein
MNRTKLITALKSLVEHSDHKTFEWTIPQSCPIQIPKSLMSGYERNIYLKENLHTVINKDKKLNCHYWTVQEWGGIGSFKRNPKNDSRISKFLDDLSKGQLTRASFECISSLSKIASFIHPEKYAIYDSRVIYSLNWLLFVYADAKQLFPQPAGRSTELAKYDMSTIFRLSGREHQYRAQNIAFHEYCAMMVDLSTQIFGEGSKPYRAEMLLFAVAPTWVVQDIQASTSLSIAKDA